MQTKALDGRQPLGQANQLSP